MDAPIPIVNETLDLADCRDAWFFDEEHGAWCLEDILYTQKATTPKFQRMSIFAPKPYINADGTVNWDGAFGSYTARTAPDASGAPGAPAGPPSLGDLVSRPPKGVEYKGLEFPLVDAPGTDKTAWLSWDGAKASIASLDDYLLAHRRRMKPCTAFDTLGMDSGENQEFGAPEQITCISTSTSPRRSRR